MRAEGCTIGNHVIGPTIEFVRRAFDCSLSAGAMLGGWLPSELVPLRPARLGIVTGLHALAASRRARLPSLLNQPIRLYSCFISYSSKDQEFAERLHADLQNKGVRCWFAPHDMPIGAKIIDALDEAIRLRDKVLLILSKGAIESDWVEEEVSKAFAEERERKQIMLFPVRLDDIVLHTSEPWARSLRVQRHIGDFIRWRDHDAYRKSFERLIRDLTVRDGGATRANY